MASNFTPGPWATDGYTVFRPADENGPSINLARILEIPSAPGADVLQCIEQARANAALIAQAPAMLAELHRMAELIESTFPAQSAVWLAEYRAIVARIEGER